WSWPHESGDRRFGAGDVVELLGGSVAAYRREYTADTVLLSGGFDSRIIAGLLQRRGDTPRGLIQRHTDENANADGRFGVLAARSMRLPYEVHDVSRDFFSSHDYLAYLHEADVDVQSFYLFIATTARLLNPSRGAVWLDTVVGSLVKRKAVADSPEDYARRIMRSDQLGARLSSLRLFTPEWRAAMHAGARESLEAEMAGIPATRQGSRELRNRTRVRTRIGAPFHRVHSGRVPVATPGLGRSSWSLSAGVPLDAAQARELLHQLLRDYMPAAARVPFASGTELS